MKCYTPVVMSNLGFRAVIWVRLINIVRTNKDVFKGMNTP